MSDEPPHGEDARMRGKMDRAEDGRTAPGDELNYPVLNSG